MAFGLKKSRHVADQTIVKPRFIVRLAPVITLVACHAARPEPSTPQLDTVEHASSVAADVSVPAPLSQAIARYRDTGEVEPLQDYVRAHPNEELGVWTEVVALHIYKQLLSEDGWDAEQALQVVHRYPGTYAAQMLATRLRTSAYDATLAELSIDDIVALLDGAPVSVPEPWSVVGIDQDEFRETYAPELRQRLEHELLATGCEQMMGYCNWWVDRHPQAESTQRLQQDMDEVWQHRRRPGWKGRSHHRCAWACGTRCRAEAKPLDDSCYEPCYATCL